MKHGNGTSSSTPAISSDVVELKDMVKALLLDKKNQSPAPTPSTTPAPVKAVELSCVTYGGTLPGNTVTNPKEDLKGITTRSGVAYPGPKTHSQSKQGTTVTKDQVQTPSSQSSAPVQPSIIQSESQDPVSEPVVAPVSTPMPNLKPSIPYPSRQMLSEMARTTMNEHCSAVILNKLPRKLGDPGKFLIPCEFSGMDECLALADLGASINLMPFSVWEALSLPELTPTCMTLELADHSVSKPIGITKDVSFKVGVFHFPADFVVVDFEPDPRVPLILGRCFLKTCRALIDVHKGELTLRIGNEAITYNLDQTELKVCEAKTIKSSVDEPPEVELKDLPHHLEYAFLEGNIKLLVIIAKELGRLKDATSVRRPSSRGSSSKNSVLINTKNHSEAVEVHVRKNTKKNVTSKKNVVQNKKIVTDVDVKNALKAKNTGLHEMSMAAFESQYIDKDTYSASAEDIEVQSCFLADQLTNLSPPRNCMPPDVLL
nr:reverse transcriptase domain-containing protein [Tanacetum cinerariifolium]